jgi:hypothetical protein
MIVTLSEWIGLNACVFPVHFLVFRVNAGKSLVNSLEISSALLHGCLWSALGVCEHDKGVTAPAGLFK